MEQLPEAWRSVEATPDDSHAGSNPPPEPATGRARLIAAGVLALAVALAGAAVLALASGSDGAAGVSVARSSLAPAMASSAGARGPASGSWKVDVAGAVAHPGLYELPEGSRVADAIRAAGGYGPRVDAAAAASTINLAEVLRDGAKVVVPERGAVAAGAGNAMGDAGSAGQAAGAGAGLIDVNRASATELDTLPGIGPVTAARIIAAREERPFQSVDELLTRKVVSASVLSKIRDLVTTAGG